MAILTGTVFRRVIRAPVFVVGAARSGTTILMNGLAVHPRILGGFGEAPIVARLGTLAWRHGSGERAEYYLRSLRTPPGHLRDRLRVLAFESAVGGRDGWPLLRKHLRSLSAKPFRAVRWSAKTFPDKRSAIGLKQLFPRGRFLFTVRSGCDAVHSRTRFHAFSGEAFEEQCRVWTESIEKFEHLSSDPDAMIVRQEDLLHRPGEVLRDVQAFLGVPHSEACAEFCGSTLQHPLDDRTRAGVDVREVLGKRKPGWLEWTADQRAAFRRTCGDAMETLGYEMPF